MGTVLKFAIFSGWCGRVGKRLLTTPKMSGSNPREEQTF